MEEKLLYKIKITGHVQGVGYRWRAANEHGPEILKVSLRTWQMGVFILKLKDRRNNLMPSLNGAKRDQGLVLLNL